MLWPETSTYEALPPSDCGRRYCTQNASARTTSAIPATLLVRCTAEANPLFLIVDRQHGPGRGRRALGGRRLINIKRVAAGVAQAPPVHAAGLDLLVDVTGHGDGLRHVARRAGGELGGARAEREAGKQVPRERLGPARQHRRHVDRAARRGRVRDVEAERRRVGAPGRGDVAAREVEADERLARESAEREHHHRRAAAVRPVAAQLVDVGVGRHARAREGAGALRERLRARPQVTRSDRQRRCRRSPSGRAGRGEACAPYGPTTAKLYERRFVARTVAPKLVNTSVPPPAGTVAFALPSAAPPGPTRVSDSVAPAQALGIEGTSTSVTVPALLALRVAEREETPQLETAAFPAESLFEPRASVAAAPHAATVAESARARPRMCAASFISIVSSKSRRAVAG